MSKKNRLDQYYTSEEAVAVCYSLISKYWNGEAMLEPSAGEGAFYNNAFSEWLMYDLEPKVEGVVRADFLSVNPDRFKGFFAIGNPPFGFCAKLAIKFINHCAKSCDKICFILPNTFHKEVFFNTHINPNVHLVESLALPKNSFVLNGQPYNVPCSVFYMSVRDYERAPLNIEQYVYEDDKGVNVRRVGGRAGRVVETYTQSSTYRLSSDTEKSVEYYLSKYAKEIETVAKQTAGVRSISVKELNHIITKGELKCNSKKVV